MSFVVQALNAKLKSFGFYPIGNRELQKAILKRGVTKPDLFLDSSLLFLNFFLNQR